MDKINWWILFYGILFLIGSLLAYAAYTQLQKTRNLLKDGIKTTAIVKEFIITRGENNNLYAPVFEYTDYKQELKTYTSKIESYPQPYKIGERIKIVYEKRKKNGNVKTISFWGLYRASVILFMIASPFLVIGGAYLAYTLI